MNAFWHRRDDKSVGVFPLYYATTTWLNVINTCDAPTRCLDDASCSRSEHGGRCATDTCTTWCWELLHGSDAAGSMTRAGGHLCLFGCTTLIRKRNWENLSRIRRRCVCSRFANLVLRYWIWLAWYFCLLFFREWRET